LAITRANFLDVCTAGSEALTPAADVIAKADKHVINPLRFNGCLSAGNCITPDYYRVSRRMQERLFHVLMK